MPLSQGQKLVQQFISDMTELDQDDYEMTLKALLVLLINSNAEQIGPKMTANIISVAFHKDGLAIDYKNKGDKL